MYIEISDSHFYSLFQIESRLKTLNRRISIVLANEKGIPHEASLFEECSRKLKILTTGLAMSHGLYELFGLEDEWETLVWKDWIPAQMMVCLSAFSHHHFYVATSDQPIESRRRSIDCQDDQEIPSQTQYHA